MSATRHADVAAHEQVERLRVDGLHERADLVRLVRPGRVEHVRTGVRVGPQPAQRFLERIGMSDEIALGAGRQQHARARRVEGCARGLHALDGQGHVEQRLRAVTGRVLDRQTSHAGAGAQGDAFGNRVGCDAVARREVGVDRDVGGAGDIGDVRQHPIARDGDVRVRQALRKREAGTGRRQRRETEMLEEACRPHIPGVRHHEAPGLVQRTEG